MFHRVLSESSTRGFQPVPNLSVTPEVFCELIRGVLGAGYEIVSLSEACERILAGRKSPKFVCLTFDDGFRDNYEIALPICREFGVPMTVYVTTGFIDGTRVMCWYGLQSLVAQNESIGFEYRNEERLYPAQTTSEKIRAYWAVDLLFRSATEHEKSQLMLDLQAGYGVDFCALASEQLMTWEMVSDLARHEGIEIGAHTMNHPALSELHVDEAREEIRRSRQILEMRLGRPIRHHAYPYGTTETASEREFNLCREEGFSTGVTTRYGHVFPRHANALHSLPRIPVNEGDTQAAIEVKLSGLSTPLRAIQHWFRPGPMGSLSRYPLGSLADANDTRAAANG